MKNFTTKFNVVTAENVSIMRKNVNYKGQFVISQKVTDKIAFCQSAAIEKIQNAGVSGMTVKDGILVNKYDLFFSNNYGGKMKEICGLSGFAGNNRKCIERAMIPGSICSKCFSFIGSKFSNLAAWTKNDTILSMIKFELGAVVMDPVKIPECRFSTHGDLINGLHAYNLFVISASNPNIQYTLWTKNNSYYQTGRKMFLAEFGYIPANLRVIFSCSNLDVIPSMTGLKALKENGYHAYFVVYSKRAIQERAVNEFFGHFCKCGKHSCKALCHFCYDLFTKWAYQNSDHAVLIAEILDGEKHKE